MEIMTRLTKQLVKFKKISKAETQIITQISAIKEGFDAVGKTLIYIT